MDSTQLLLALVDALQRISKPAPDPTAPQKAHLNASPTVEELFGTPTSILDCTTTDDVLGGQGIGDASGSVNRCSLPSASQAPLRETALHFAKRRPLCEADLQPVCTLLRKIIDATSLPAECFKIAYMGPELDKAISLIKPLALADMRVSMYMCSVLANLTAVKESRMQLNTTLVWNFLMLIAQTYVTERRVLQLVFMTMSNVAYLEELRLTREECKVLCRLILPGYTDVQLVESWVTMLCNMTALHPKTMQVFVEIGVVELLERLVLYVGEEGKTAIRGVQCLANLAEGFTSGHVPALDA